MVFFSVDMCVFFVYLGVIFGFPKEVCHSCFKFANLVKMSVFSATQFRDLKAAFSPDSQT